MRRYVVNGNSMFPVLKDGQACMVLEGRKRYDTGEVICISRMGQKVIHRLILKERVLGKRIMIEKGDNYAVASIITEDEIIGKAVLPLQKKSCVFCSKIQICLIYLLNKFLVFLSKSCFKKRTEFVKFLGVYVVPTIILRDQTLAICIDELKKSYKNLLKYNRFKELSKVIEKK